MNILGYTESGAIRVKIDGVEMTVPDDMGNRHRQMIAEWEAQGNTIPPYVPPAPTLADYKAAFDSHLDEVAQQRQYDNRLTVPSYKGSTNPQWAAEADVYVAWRDAALLYMFAMLEDWQNGEIEQPTVEAFIAGITPIVWPK